MSTIAPATATLSTPATAPVAAAPLPTPAADADTAGASGGGALGDFVMSGIGKLVSYASKGMQAISDALRGEMDAKGGGAVNAAKVQGYVMQMSNYDNIIKMAAKLQEKEDEAVKIWLR